MHVAVRFINVTFLNEMKVSNLHCTGIYDYPQ